MTRSLASFVVVLLASATALAQDPPRIGRWDPRLDALGDPHLEPAARRVAAQLEHRRVWLPGGEQTRLELVRAVCVTSGLPVLVAPLLAADLDRKPIQTRAGWVTLRDALADAIEGTGATLGFGPQGLELDRSGLAWGSAEGSFEPVALPDRAPACEAAGRAALEAYLDRDRITLHLEGCPFSECVSFLRDITRVPLVTTPLAIDASEEAYVTIETRRVTLRDALAQVTAKAGLGWRVEPERIVIARRDEPKAPPPGPEVALALRVLARPLATALEDARPDAVARALEAASGVPCALDRTVPTEGVELDAPAGASVEDVCERLALATGATWTVEAAEAALRLRFAADTGVLALLDRLEPAGEARQARRRTEARGLDEVRAARDAADHLARRALIARGEAWLTSDAGGDDVAAVLVAAGLQRALRAQHREPCGCFELKGSARCAPCTELVARARLEAKLAARIAAALERP